MKLSVAMATYNGEKYIEEQLKSILSQTHMVDEIIISDDGSKDNTLKIAENLLRNSGVSYSILTNNPRHFPCGNFEWAVKHCTGDIIYLCDQDDIWLNNKVEETKRIFADNNDVKCIVHNADYIDKNSNKINGRLPVANLPTGKLSKEEYLTKSAAAPITNGMVMCFRKELLDFAIPFPKSMNVHDQWIGFCSICVDGLYHSDKILTLYRLHDNNYSGNKVFSGSIFEVIKKIRSRFANPDRYLYEMYYLGLSEKNVLEHFGYQNTDAYATANRIYRIGKRVLDDYEKPRLAGTIDLVKFYKNDASYRSIGSTMFIFQLLGIWRNKHRKNKVETKQ